MKTFFDTNVLVYLFDAGSRAKQRRARELLRGHTSAGETLISTQVLQEFYVATTSKLRVPLATEDARVAVRELAALPTVLIDAETILAAVDAQREHRISFWDALIVEAALRGGASVLLSEDLHPGATFGGLRVANPFAA